MALPDPEEALAKARGQEDDEDDEELLPASEVIEINVKDGRGKRYKGRFFYTVPNNGVQIEIGKMKAQYLPQGSPADINAAGIVDVICYLTCTITFNDTFPKPDWWNPLSQYTMLPFTELYGRCLEYEAKFHGERPQHRDDEGELREAGELPGDDPVRVGGEVRPPAKRRETLAGDGA